MKQQWRDPYLSESEDLRSFVDALRGFLQLDPLYGFVEVNRYSPIELERKRGVKRVWKQSRQSGPAACIG